MNKNIKWIVVVIGLIFVGMILGIALSPQNGTTTTSISTITSTTTAYSTYTSTSTFSNTFTTTSAIISTQTLTTTLPVTFTTTSSQYATVTTTVTPVQPSDEVVGVYFSPKGGCAGQVAYWIGRANSSVHVLIYSFTLSNIGDALIQAS